MGLPSSYLQHWNLISLLSFIQSTRYARTFNDLVKVVFAALDKPANIEYIDTPVDIRETYQYFTEAKMGKLKMIGYSSNFTDMESGVAEYISLIHE
jgi:ADP-L-glycero-D-manno-heptose 6-epimerase